MVIGGWRDQGEPHGRQATAREPGYSRRPRILQGGAPLLFSLVPDNGGPIYALLLSGTLTTAAFLALLFVHGLIEVQDKAAVCLRAVAFREATRARLFQRRMPWSPLGTGQVSASLSITVRRERRSWLHASRRPVRLGQTSLHPCFCSPRTPSRADDQLG
jgi:hypothetical protein